MTATTVLFPLAALLRWVSRIVCLIVVVSFAIFVVGQTSTASTHQQNELNETTPTTTQPVHKSALHSAIDEASGQLTSPFASITAHSSSQWLVRGEGTLMALLVYGIGLGYVARMLRVRV